MTFLYRNLIADMSGKYQVDPSIVDYNLTILDECVTILVNKRHAEESLSHHRTFFHVEEWQLALEFFLQFDGETGAMTVLGYSRRLCLADVFLHKTCSARSMGSTEGLFSLDVPESRYQRTSCEQLNCPCCHRLTERSDGVHRFVNGYQAYLNGPAVGLLSNSLLSFLTIDATRLQNCQSSNVIYALTCPCGKFDYVDETPATFRELFLCQFIR